MAKGSDKGSRIFACAPCGEMVGVGTGEADSRVGRCDAMYGVSDGSQERDHVGEDRCEGGVVKAEASFVYRVMQDGGGQVGQW